MSAQLPEADQWLLQDPDTGDVEAFVRGLSEEDYESKRKPIANALGWRVSKVDELRGDSGEENKSQATELVELAEANVEEFFNHEDEAWARFPVGDHSEVARLSQRSFRRFLQRLYFQAKRRAPGSQAVQDAIGVLEGEALFENEAKPVFNRIAPGQTEQDWWIDLGDEDHRAIHIKPGTWEIVDEPPVMFRRPAGMRELPEPDPNGNIDELSRFVNIRDECDECDDVLPTQSKSTDWILFLSWIAQAFRPSGPYPVLVLLGEQGTAKSSTATTAGSLVDPTDVDRQTLPRDEQSLAIWAQHSHVLRVDNVSNVPNWLSDALARLSTGGGALYRTLYSDDELSVFKAQRPVIVNGITDFVHRPDLLQRSIVLYLPRIDPKERWDETRLNKAFADASPRIFGGLLNLLARAAAHHPVDPGPLPRMADFARWACAVEMAAGWPEGAFLEAYQANQRSSSETVLHGSSVASAVRALVEDHGAWEGTITELLEALNEREDEATTRSKYWPNSAKALGQQMQRKAPLLRNVGIEVEQNRSRGSRTIALRLGTHKNVTNVTNVTAEDEYRELGASRRGNSENGVAV
jgi:hypothetical protein